MTHPIDEAKNTVTHPLCAPAHPTQGVEWAGAQRGWVTVFLASSKGWVMQFLASRKGWDILF